MPPRTNYDDYIADTLRNIMGALYHGKNGRCASQNDFNQSPYAYTDPNPPVPKDTIDLEFKEID